VVVLDQVQVLVLEAVQVPLKVTQKMAMLVGLVVVVVLVLY
jgi:hypothetical protein